MSHNVDLKVVVGYFSVPYSPFSLDGFALCRMNIECSLWERVNLLDQAWGQDDHRPAINARQDEGAIDTGILLIQLSVAFLEQTRYLVLPCYILQMPTLWSSAQI